MKNLEDLLTGLCQVPNEQLPDVLIVNDINEFRCGKGPPSLYQIGNILSLLTEASEYIGRRKRSRVLLYV